MFLKQMFLDLTTILTFWDPENILQILKLLRKLWRKFQTLQRNQKNKIWNWGIVVNLKIFSKKLYWFVIHLFSVKYSQVKEINWIFKIWYKGTVHSNKKKLRNFSTSVLIPPPYEKFFFAYLHDLGHERKK